MKSLNETIKETYGNNVNVVSRTQVSGGDINLAYAVNLSDGSRVFMKANRPENEDFFRAEAEALDIIRNTNTIRAPKVIGRGSDDTESFLLMEFIEPGPRKRSSYEELGENLAMMHLADTKEMVHGGKYGFTKDNYSGSLHQDNTPCDSWIEFFRNCRLMPRFEQASNYFDTGDRKSIDRFLDRLDKLLIEPEKPSLIHGDLWGGNHLIDALGHPWIIDPSAYVGHAEADIGMTELFGGFDSAFYDSYISAVGLDSGYKDRRDIYNLFHLLNHLILFGSGYFESVMSIVRRYAG